MEPATFGSKLKEIQTQINDMFSSRQSNWDDGDLRKVVQGLDLRVKFLDEVLTAQNEALTTQNATLNEVHQMLKDGHNNSFSSRRSDSNSRRQSFRSGGKNESPADAAQPPLRVPAAAVAASSNNNRIRRSSTDGVFGSLDAFRKAHEEEKAKQSSEPASVAGKMQRMATR
eukprot:5465471-Prymnesium_polylepis.1